MGAAGRLARAGCKIPRKLFPGHLDTRVPDVRGGSGRASKHAWAEDYAPGAGWIAFDPTNRSVGGVNLIPVAVGHDMLGPAPVGGSYAGRDDMLESMVVEIDIV